MRNSVLKKLEWCDLKSTNAIKLAVGFAFKISYEFDVLYT